MRKVWILKFFIFYIDIEYDNSHINIDAEFKPTDDFPYSEDKVIWNPWWEILNKRIIKIWFVYK